MNELLRVGTPAPSFSAPASDGGTYALEELLAKGPIALFFYPGNDTPG